MEELRKIIEKQRKGKENSPVWMVGQQLLDIAAGDLQAIELLKKDLEVPEMDLIHAEAKIKEWADEHKKGNCCCVSPKVADGILRKFYALRELPELGVTDAPVQRDSGYIDIESFL